MLQRQCTGASSGRASSSSSAFAGQAVPSQRRHSAAAAPSRAAAPGRRAVVVQAVSGGSRRSGASDVALGFQKPRHGPGWSLAITRRRERPGTADQGLLQRCGGARQRRAAAAADRRRPRPVPLPTRTPCCARPLQRKLSHLRKKMWKEAGPPPDLATRLFTERIIYLVRCWAVAVLLCLPPAAVVCVPAASYARRIWA